MHPSRVTVEPTSERGLQALKVTITVPPGVLAQAAPVAEREVEGLMVEAMEAVRRTLIEARFHRGVAA